MGKPFKQELDNIPGTVAAALKIDVKELASFFSSGLGSPFILVGSGGSYTAAVLAALIIEDNHGLALVQTPLEFIRNKTDIHDCSVVIFTASGNNKDVLAALEASAIREAKHTLVFCGSHNSRIQKEATNYRRVASFCFSIPTIKDGYLATNSLLAFSLLTIAAFKHPFISQSIVGPALESQSIKEVSQHYIVLFSDWGRPAAIDMESKFSEAGLASVMVADYRNFAHGRHNWIDKKGTNTTVLALVTPEARPLAEKTLKLIRPHVPTFEIETSLSGCEGSIELLLRVFALTRDVGNALGIDPGRPGVPKYGSDLYRLGPTPIKHRITPQSYVGAALRRKAQAQGASSDFQTMKSALVTYSAEMGNRKFKALALDFDGTIAPPRTGNSPLPKPIQTILTTILEAGIYIFFATGRGDSIHGSLESTFDKALWKYMRVSYYNGAITLPFVNRHSASAVIPHLKNLDDVYKQLSDHVLLKSLAKCLHSQCQLTIKLFDSANDVSVLRIVNEVISSYSDVRVVQSSHSVDVIPSSSSKLNAVRLAAETVGKGFDVLAIGDRGGWPGNDYELLTHPYSLSVDTVSTNLDSCWNYLPCGKRNVEGFAIYGKWMKVYKGYFTLKIPGDFS